MISNLLIDREAGHLNQQVQAKAIYGSRKKREKKGEQD